MGRFFQIAVFVAVFSVTGSVRANDAKAAFEEGLSLFNAGVFADAATMFRQANQLKPNWKILFNLAQAEASAKQYGLAISSFEAYLAKGGDDIDQARRAYVIGELRQLREMVGFVLVTGPDGIDVEIDGIDRGELPLSAPVAVAASVDHQLVAKLDGVAVFDKSVQVMGQQQATVEVHFEKNQKMLQSGGIDWESNEDGHGRFGVWGVLLLSVGAAALVSSSVTGALALKQRDLVATTCSAGCTSADWGAVEKRDRLAHLTDGLWIGGAVLATVGLAAVLFRMKKKKGTEHVSTRKVAIGPLGVGLIGQF